MVNKKPSPAQQAAMSRNWRIRCMRAFYHLIPSVFTDEEKDTIKKIVDTALARMGAESESVRVDKIMKELEGAFKDP